MQVYKIYKNCLILWYIYIYICIYIYIYVCVCVYLHFLLNWEENDEIICNQMKFILKWYWIYSKIYKILYRYWQMVQKTRIQSQVESYKDSKMVLDASLFNTQHYKVQIKGKRRNPRKGDAPYYSSWCSSYWKGNLQIAFKYIQPNYIDNRL